MRTWLIILALVVVTVVYAVAVTLHMLLWRNPDVYFAYARAWSRLVLRWSGVKVIVEGHEHLVPAERYVYASNHASMFDIPVILAFVPDNVRIMYKKELERVPFFGWSLAVSPFIAIDRSRTRQAAAVLDEVTSTLRQGSSVLVFPEGTRSADGRVQEFRRGAFSLAVKSERQIVPVALIGTASILPKGTRRLRGGTVHVRIFPPIDVPASATREEEKGLMVRVHDIIAHAVDSHP
ncbi:MAG: 1-acyl-sn-glycerol-3-phosphate acyltransferase [Candidatus Kapabacteria bacterium]|nr:1-acyl-sn-glycerol-3-phosphate acyltransferase [Candidatus Kapabacteria bacterium]